MRCECDSGTLRREKNATFSAAGAFGRIFFGARNAPPGTLDHVFVDALRQLVAREGGEGAAEGRFARNVPRTFPATEAAERGAGAQRVQERAGGGNL